jgi:hypothetical protein
MKLHGVAHKKKGQCHSREDLTPHLRNFSLFMEENRNRYKILIVKSERKPPYTTYRRELENNFKINFLGKEKSSANCTYVSEAKEGWRTVVQTAMDR